MTEEEKIICKQFLNDADKTHSCNEYKLLMALLEQETVSKEVYDLEYYLRNEFEIKIAKLQHQLKALEQEPKSEWEQDHAILKAHSDGANEVLDKIRAEIMDTGAYEQETKGRTEFLEGINYCLGVIDKYKGEKEQTNA